MALDAWAPQVNPHNRYNRQRRGRYSCRAFDLQLPQAALKNARFMAFSQFGRQTAGISFDKLKTSVNRPAAVPWGKRYARADISQSDGLAGGKK